MKNFVLLDLPKVQVQSGTIDRHNIKSIFIKFSSQYQSDIEDPTNGFKSLLLEIRRAFMRNIKDSIFKDRFIYDTDIPDTFNQRAGGFINIEFTLYLNDLYDVSYVEEVTNNLIRNVYLESFDKQKHFNIRKRAKV